MRWHDTETCQSLWYPDGNIVEMISQAKSEGSLCKMRLVTDDNTLLKIVKVGMRTIFLEFGLKISFRKLSGLWQKDCTAWKLISMCKHVKKVSHHPIKGGCKKGIYCIAWRKELFWTYKPNLLSAFIQRLLGYAA